MRHEWLFRVRVVLSVPESLRRLELTFYKNSIIHWFVLEAIVATALYASIKPHIRVAQPEDISKFKVNKRDLLNDVRFVSQLLKLVRPDVMTFARVG